MAKNLVAFFSATGSTRKVANIVAEVTGADVYEIKPAVAYTNQDLNWNKRNSRSSIEMADETSRPELADKEAPVANYDVIYLGFPIWWYVAPHIINKFLESYNFSGKTIIIFATSGGSGFGETLKKLKPCSPNAKFIEGKVFRGRADKADVEEWIQSLNI